MRPELRISQFYGYKNPNNQNITEEWSWNPTFTAAAAKSAERVSSSVYYGWHAKIKSWRLLRAKLLCYGEFTTCQCMKTEN